MELDLKGKVAVVTGANRGIGAGVARQLAAEGMNVALVARDAAALEDTRRALADLGAQAMSIPVDLKAPEAADRVVGAVAGAWGGVDVLVNNAGATRRGDFFELDDADWFDGFALKFHGYVRMTRAIWPHLRARGGSIVNIIGVGGHAGVGEFTIGGAVNSALYNFTKAMSEVGRADGVRVNAVNPGRIETDRLRRNIDRLARLKACSTAEATKMLLAECGIERFGTVEEIGAAVAFLASSKATFVQGSLFDVDGGENLAI